MRACSDCFAPGAASGLTLAGAEFATCALCLRRELTWSTEAWSEVLSPVLKLYVPTESGKRLIESILSDWDIIGESATQPPDAFLDEVCGVLGLSLTANSHSALKLGQPAAGDMWELFRHEIGEGRRWFFEELDAERFQRFLELCVTMRSENAIDAESVFYRARVLNLDSKGFRLKDLEAPPSDKSTGGRANPAGIRMLYASTSEDIAVHEVRPSRRASVYTARFRPRARIVLADFTPTSNHKPNPFSADEKGDPYDPADVYVAVTLGTIVGEALSEPLRESDNRTEYLPTQYVAEFVRHSGRQGIRFRSSFCSEATGLEGDNVVLFDPNVVATIRESLKEHVVTEVGVTYRPA